MPEDGRNQISLGFMINTDAVARYKAVSGKTVEYGIFAVAQEKLGDKDVFDENGNVAEGVVNVEFSNYEYVAIEFRMYGFTEANKDAKIALGAYVVTTLGDETEYSYLQAGTPNANEKYCFISYSEIAGE